MCFSLICTFPCHACTVHVAHVSEVFCDCVFLTMMVFFFFIAKSISAIVIMLSHIARLGNYTKDSHWL